MVEVETWSLGIRVKLRGQARMKVKDWCPSGRKKRGKVTSQRAKKIKCAKSTGVKHTSTNRYKEKNSNCFYCNYLQVLLRFFDRPWNAKKKIYMLIY